MILAGAEADVVVVNNVGSPPPPVPLPDTETFLVAGDFDVIEVTSIEGFLAAGVGGKLFAGAVVWNYQQESDY